MEQKTFQEKLEQDLINKVRLQEESIREFIDTINDFKSLTRETKELIESEISDELPRIVPESDFCISLRENLNNLEALSSGIKELAKSIFERQEDIKLRKEILDSLLKTEEQEFNEQIEIEENEADIDNSEGETSSAEFDE